MAYYNDQDDEQLKNDPNAPAGVQTAGESGTITGQGAGGPGGAATAAAEPQSTGASPGASGQFVGIKQYLDANKPQSAKLARDVSGYAEGLGNEARSQLEKGTNSFNQAVDQNTVNLNQELVDQAKIDPVKIANDKDQLDQFKKMRDAQYKGPSSFDESEFFQPVKLAVNKATEAASNTGTESGQKQLLSQLQTAKKGKVNQGALSFDSALLQADPNAKNILAETRKGLEDIPGNLTKAQEDALKRVSGATQASDATKSAIQSSFSGDTGVQSLLEKELQKKAQDASNQSKAQADQTMSLLKSGAEPSDEQLKLLNITRGKWNELTGDRALLESEYGVNPYKDLSVYGTVKNPETQINAQNIASADDYARYAALNELMGTQNTFLSDPSKAGTADLDALDFDYAGAKTNIQNSIQLEKQAKAQREAEAAAAAARAAEEARRREEERSSSLAAAAAYAATRNPVTAVVAKIFCFLEGTPILMEDGSFRSVQDIKLGDRVAYGGAVISHGVSLCLKTIEYLGVSTSENHAVFDGNKYVRAFQLRGSIQHDFKDPVKVYPISTEKHFLISNNGVVYSDFMEVDVPGCSDSGNIMILNSEERLKLSKSIEQELAKR